MMRLLFSILIFPTICLSQPLAQLKTREQIEDYIKENFRYYGFRYDKFVIDSMGSNADGFKEGDFNHDGIKDLLVVGTAHVSDKAETYKEDEIVIIVGDKNRPRKAKFPYGFFRGLGLHIVPHPKAIRIGQKDFVVINYVLNDYRERTSQTLYDTLFIGNDRVIPFRNKQGGKVVSRVEFKTNHCFGTCPVFEMTIDKSLDVEYNGIDHVDKEGHYQLRIDGKDWDYITRLISNLQVEDLKDNYSVGWTDDQTGTLTVVFEDGSKKTIGDYGMRGTFGLSIVYDYFFELRKF